MAKDKNEMKNLHELALKYENAGDIELAIKYYNLLKLQTPFDKTVHFKLGKLYFEKKCYPKAIKSLMQAIKLDSLYFEAIYLFGEAHEELDELEMAEMIYLRILELNPADITTFEHLGHLYIKLNNIKRAIRYFQEALALNHDSAESYLGLGLCFDKKNQFIEARRFYKKYLELKPASEEKDFVLSRLEKFQPKKKQTISAQNYIALVK